jgi:hypothetical protein
MMYRPGYGYVQYGARVFQPAGGIGWGNGANLAVAYVNASNELRVWVTNEGTLASPSWHNATGDLNSQTVGTPDVDGIVFQNGGTYPASLYLATHENGADCEVWYCQDPFAGSPTWSRLSALLSDLEFHPYNIDESMYPKPQSNPAGTGEVLAMTRHTSNGSKKYAAIFKDGSLVHQTYYCESFERRIAWIDENYVLGYALNSGTRVLVAVPKNAALTHLSTSLTQLAEGYPFCPGPPWDNGWHPGTLPQAATAFPSYGFQLCHSGKLYLAEEAVVCTATYYGLDDAGADIVPDEGSSQWDTVPYGLYGEHPDGVPGAMARWEGSGTYILYSEDGFSTPSTKITPPGGFSSKRPGIALVPESLFIFYKDNGAGAMKVAQYRFDSGWGDRTGDFVESTAQRVNGKSIAVMWGKNG